MSDLDWVTTLDERPTQLTREHLKRMRPDQIDEARHRGHLDDLLTPKPSPWHDVQVERIHRAVATGTVNDLISTVTTPPETPEETE